MSKNSFCCESSRNSHSFFLLGAMLSNLQGELTPHLKKQFGGIFKELTFFFFVRNPAQTSPMWINTASKKQFVLRHIQGAHILFLLGTRLRHLQGELTQHLKNSLGWASSRSSHSFFLGTRLWYLQGELTPHLKKQFGEESSRNSHSFFY